jgi:hypothetical protein
MTINELFETARAHLAALEQPPTIRAKPMHLFFARQAQWITAPPEMPDACDWFDHVLGESLGQRFIEAAGSLKAVAYELNGATEDEAGAVMQTEASWAHLLDAEGRQTYAQLQQVYCTAVARIRAEFEAHGIPVDVSAT